MQVRAPWTDEQVAALNKLQQDGRWHPYTCGKRDAHPYQGSIVIKHEDPEIDGKVMDIELDVLVATESGWVCPCPDCDYTQDWAHDFSFSQSKVSKPRFDHNRKLPPEWEDARELRQEPIPLSELAKTQAEKDAEEGGL